MPSTKTEERNAKIERMLDGIMSDYVTVCGWPVYDQLIPPDRVRAAIRSHVAKTGNIRFKKGLPPMRNPDESPNEAYLFWMLKAHMGMGAYRPIDSIMLARWEYGAELVEAWENTVELMYRWAR